jgi:hypothetical protein
MAEKVMERLKRHGFPYPFEHLCYNGAGHAIPSACIPTILSVRGGQLALGGTPEANAGAQRDSRPRVLRFLREHLQQNLGAL